MNILNRKTLALAIFVLGNVTHAESLQSYAQQCINELELKHIPAFSCFDGVRTPTVDPNAYLGQLDTGNEDVEAVYLCRGATPTAGSGFLVGLIVQNADNGKVCFFDTKPTAVNPGQVPSVSAANADQFWKTPDEMVDSPPGLSHCHKCHNNDAFLVNDSVLDTMAHLDLLNTGRPLITTQDKPTMDIIGQAFNADGWNDDLMPTPGFTGCTGCHQSSDNPRYAGRSSDMPPSPGSKYLQKPLPKLDDAETGMIDDESTGLGWFNTGPKDWFHNTGRTFSFRTGPNQGSYGSNGYYYVETSRGFAYDQGDTAILESDFFNPNLAYLTFDVNLHGEDVGTIHVDVWQKSTSQWIDSVWSLDGQSYAGRDRPDFWLSREINLEQFDNNGESIKVRFRVVANGGYQGDIAIDRLLLSRRTPISLRNRSDNTCLKIFGFNGPTSSGGDELETCDDDDFAQQLFSRDMGEGKVRVGGDWTRNTGSTSEYCWYVRNDRLEVEGCNYLNSTARPDYVWQPNPLSNGYTQFVSEAEPSQCMSFAEKPNGKKSTVLVLCDPSDAKQQWLVTRKEKRL